MNTTNPTNPAPSYNEWMDYILSTLYKRKVNLTTTTNKNTIMTKINTAQDLFDELERLLHTYGTLNVPIDGWAGEEHYDLHTLQTNMEGQELYRLQINLTKD